MEREGGNYKNKYTRLFLTCSKFGRPPERRNPRRYMSVKEDEEFKHHSEKCSEIQVIIELPTLRVLPSSSSGALTTEVLEL